MSAPKVLALATLFLATTFAQAEWKEFTFPDGNFRVVFPNNPQRLRGTRRNLHQFSAIAGPESSGIAYADSSPGTDWKSAVDDKRDFNCEPSWCFRGGREEYLTRRLPREMGSFRRTQYERRAGYLPRRAPVVLATRFRSEEC